jgi:anti-sigma-K factor RskA
MTEHEELENSVAAFLLGALEDDEASMVAAHLAGCTECSRLAGRLRRAVDALPLTVEPVQPPARLRAKILAAAAVPSHPGAELGSRSMVIATRPAGFRPRTPWVRTLTRYPTAAIAILALAVVGLGAWNLSLTGQVARDASQYSVGSRTFSGTGALRGSDATVVDYHGQAVAFVSFSRLPVAPSGKVYQLWLLPPSGPPLSAGVFQPGQDGGATVLIRRDLRDFKALALTVEDGPAGASAPTQPPGLLGNTV